MSGMPKNTGDLTTGQIWEEYGDRLIGFVTRRVGNPADVDDIVQEIIIKTHRNLAKVRDVRKLRAWLFAVARNAITDHYRRAGGDPTTRARQPEAEAHGDPGADDDALLELAGCVEPFLRRLAEPYRDALTAVDLQGVSQIDLAGRLDLSHSAIKSRVQRGRRMLRHEFEKCCRFEVDAAGFRASVRRAGECC